jgi:hypothetical protein
MNKYIIIFIVIVLIYIVFLNGKDNFEPFSNYSSSCGYFPELLEEAMIDRKMIYNKNEYEMYIPCTYNGSETDILKFENKKSKKLFLIDGCDQLASKLFLWDALREEYKDMASIYMPATHLLENKKDMTEFPIHFEKNRKKKSDQLYILKNYAQRQKGLKLTRDLKEIMNGVNNGWYLVQDYIYNPFLIDGHKINMRYYLLIICKDNKIESYIHKDGFMYYTPLKYDEKDDAFDKHITTGYIDRKIYDENPLTLQEFRTYLNEKQNGLSIKWDNNAEVLMTKIMNALHKKVCTNSKLDNHVRFQLFGCDLAAYENLDASLIEINKGPDLDAKDERDKKVKLQVQKDLLQLIDPIPEDKLSDNRFIKLKTI